MSGGHFPYPKHVWAPTGGWWFTPRNANSNFLIVGSVAWLLAFGVFKYGQSIEYSAADEYDSATVNKWEAAAKNKLAKE